MEHEMGTFYFLPRVSDLIACFRAGKACLEFLFLGIGCVLFVVGFTAWEQGKLVFQPGFPQVVWRSLDNISDDYLYEGVALSALGKFDSAIFWYNQAIEADPQNLEALTKKAIAMSSKGELRESLRLFDEVLLEQPHNMEALLGKAGTLSLLQEYDVAEAVYDLILKEDPGNVTALLGKGLVLVRYQRFSDAIHIFDKLAFLAPRDLEIQFYRAMVLQRVGEKETAFYLFGRVLDQQPENEDARAAYQILEKELGFGQFKIAE